MKLSCSVTASVERDPPGLILTWVAAIGTTVVATWAKAVAVALQTTV